MYISLHHESIEVSTKCYLGSSFSLFLLLFSRNFFIQYPTTAAPSEGRKVWRYSCVPEPVDSMETYTPTTQEITVNNISMWKTKEQSFSVFDLYSKRYITYARHTKHTSPMADTLSSGNTIDRRKVGIADRATILAKMTAKKQWEISCFLQKGPSNHWIRGKVVGIHPPNYSPPHAWCNNNEPGYNTQHCKRNTSD